MTSPMSQADIEARRAALLELLPLRYVDGPDYCTVWDAKGRDFAITVQPELMKAMEAATSAKQPRIPTMTDSTDSERAALAEWKDAVLGCCKACSGFDALHWGGDKDGWGFVMYFISHLNTRAVMAETALRASHGNAGVAVEWQPIEHPHRPASIEQERASLKQRIELEGLQAIPNMLMQSALALPGQGSFAGMLWAAAEWTRVALSRPLPKGGAETTIPVEDLLGGNATSEQIAERMDQTYRVTGDKWFKFAADRLRALSSTVPSSGEVVAWQRRGHQTRPWLNLPEDVTDEQLQIWRDRGFEVRPLTVVEPRDDLGPGNYQTDGGE